MPAGPDGESPCNGEILLQKGCGRHISSRSKALPLPVGIPDRQSFVESKLQLFSSTQAAVILQLAYVHAEMKYFPQVLAEVALFKLYLRLTALLWPGLVLFFFSFFFCLRKYLDRLDVCKLAGDGWVSF